MRPESVLVANTFSTSRLYDHESVTNQRAFGEFFNFKLPTTRNRIIITQLEPLPPRSQLVEKAQSFADRLEKYGVPILRYPSRLSTRVDWDMSRRQLTDQYVWLTCCEATEGLLLPLMAFWVRGRSMSQSLNSTMVPGT